MELRKGQLRDLDRYYALIETDYKAGEVISLFSLRRAMLNGRADYWLLHDPESGMDIGYALVLVKNLYDYAVLKYIGVFPWYRGRGFGAELMREVNKQYADEQGIVAELPVYEGEEDRARKLRKYFGRFGYVLAACPHELNGTKAEVLVKPQKGTEKIEPVAHRIIANAYYRL